MTNQNEFFRIQLNEYLDKKAREYGFSQQTAQSWKKYMLDSQRGEDVYGWLSNMDACRTNSRILEIGCGFGAVTEGIAKHAPRVYGFDIHEDRAYFTKKRIALLKSSSQSSVAGIIQANGLNIPYAPASFDLVLCMDVMEHVPAQYHNRLFSEISRVLGNEGVLFLTVSNRLALRDNHNDHLILGTWLPMKLRKYYWKLLAQSDQYDPTWDVTSLGLVLLAHRHGFSRFDDRPFWRYALQGVFNHYFQIILQKKESNSV